MFSEPAGRATSVVVERTRPRTKVRGAGGRLVEDVHHLVGYRIVGVADLRRGRTGGLRHPGDEFGGPGVEAAGGKGTRERGINNVRRRSLAAGLGGPIIIVKLQGFVENFLGH
ncbi:hypothetical protein BHM03_00004791 [Ensete ventricosum]|nr:hypothetical protein BHM03_00004791 [Ensete ventricosum]